MVYKKRKRITKIKQSESKYKTLFHSIDEGCCIIDVIFESGRPVDFRHLEVNPAYYIHTGLHDIEGKTASEIGALEEYWLQLYGNIVMTGQSIRTENLWNNHWYSVYAFQVNPNKPNRIAVLFKDITEEVENKRAMEESIKIQDEVFANVSHELKTPLSVIFGTAQLMKHYVNNQSTCDLKSHLLKNIETINQNCYRFTRLINNIVDLSKMDSGFYKLEMKNHNIVEVVENLVQSVAKYIESKELSIIFDTDSEELFVKCDSEKIERILLNLISNAVKFTDPGGTIHVAVLEKEGHIELSVRDTGVGIEKKYLDSIFKRYHQVDKTLSRNAEGSGIGLALVKSLVELHGGRITVESQRKIGSTFTIELPYQEIGGKVEMDRKGESCTSADLVDIEFSDIYIRR